MMVEEIIQSLSQENDSLWETATEQLSLGHLISRIADVAGISLKGKSNPDKVGLVWGEKIFVFFCDHFLKKHPQTISDEERDLINEKQQWSNFCASAEAPLQNVRGWLMTAISSYVNEHPQKALTQIKEKCKSSFGEHEGNHNFKKTIAAFACYYLYLKQTKNFYNPKDNVRKEVWDQTQSECLHNFKDVQKHLLATKTLLAADPYALLARCVIFVSVRHKNADTNFFEKYWMPSDDELKKMAENSTEAACYAAQYFAECGTAEALREILNAIFSQKTTLNSSLLKIVLRISQDLFAKSKDVEKPSDFWNYVSRVAESGNPDALCLLGELAYHHWRNDWDEENLWMQCAKRPDLSFISMENRGGIDELIFACFDAALKNTEADEQQQAQCQFYMGCVREWQGKNLEASMRYEAAKKLTDGKSDWSHKAAMAMNKSDLVFKKGDRCNKTTEIEGFPILIKQNKYRQGNYAFVMGESAPYRAFVESLGDSATEWNIILFNMPLLQGSAYYSCLPCNFQNQLYTQCRDINWSIDSIFAEPKKISSKEKIPQLLFAFFDENQETNVRKTAKLLDILSEKLGVVRRNFSDTLKSDFYQAVSKIRVYVSVESEIYANLLDSIQNSIFRTYGFYIPLIIINKYTDTAQELFYRYPLFLPFEKEDKEGRPLNLVVLGTGPSAMAIVREAIGLPIARHKTIISVVGADAEKAMRRFRQDCPALMEPDSWLLSCLEVNFYECSLDELPLHGFGDQNPLSNILQNGDYYVVTSEQDSLNQEIGIRLRETLLSLEKEDFSQQPLITVRCSDNVDGLLMECMTLRHESGGNQWYSNYNLKKFGSSQLFSHWYLENNPVECRAKKIHLSYAGIEDDEPTANYCGLQDYYLRYYNRISSRSTAVSLTYRAFDIGIYDNTKSEQELGIIYLEKILNTTDTSFLESAVVAEHTRWCLQLTSRGWKRASLTQIENYHSAGCPSHQLYIAKLHPYLVPWDELTETYVAVNECFRDKSLKDPQITTKESILGSAKYLSK